MKNTLLLAVAAVTLLFAPLTSFTQAPVLGTAADFVLFSSNGAVGNTGISQVTGNVGTNNGSSTTFGNVNGVMHDMDAASAQCMTDLLVAYNQMNAAIPDYFIAPLMGNGDTLIAGVYSVTGAATLDFSLYLDAEGDSNAVFIFQLSGPLSASADAKVRLLNGAMACNVFWKVEGLVSLASGTYMCGTVVANNAAISLAASDTLEGRALSTTGAISIDGVLAFTPIGCGSPVLTGPLAPDLGTAGCYGLFSGDGAVTNTGITNVIGDVGTNVGLTTGFDPLLVTGTIHPSPDLSTAQCASDLTVVYNYLNALPFDIELLYPAQFGRGLVLTPHTYYMNSAADLTDSLYLNAQGNPDAVFVIQINGALISSTYAHVILINGAQSRNVYWKIEGETTLNNYTIFCGTIICNNGALGAINTGVVLDGRALTTVGALNTTAMSTTLPADCGPLGIAPVAGAGNVATLFPNPVSSSLHITMSEGFAGSCSFSLRNAMGQTVMVSSITDRFTTMETGTLSTGIYFYTLVQDGKSVSAGKLLVN